MRPVVMLALFAPSLAFALEGHWRPSQLPLLAPELSELGLKVPVSKLADPAAAPLGAILDMDLCSGAFVSADGLVMTAYHCVTEGLLYASGEDEDLFEEGFDAPDRAGEPPVDRARAVHPAAEASDERQGSHGDAPVHLADMWLLIRRPLRSMLMSTWSIHPRWTLKVDWP